MSDTASQLLTETSWDWQEPPPGLRVPGLKFEAIDTSSCVRAVQPLLSLRDKLTCACAKVVSLPSVLPRMWFSFFDVRPKSPEYWSSKSPNLKEENVPWTAARVGTLSSSPLLLTPCLVNKGNVVSHRRLLNKWTARARFHFESVGKLWGLRA